MFIEEFQVSVVQNEGLSGVGKMVNLLIDIQRLYKAINKVKATEFENVLSLKLSEAFSNEKFVKQKLVFFYHM